MLLILGDRDVRQVLPYRECVDVMRDALAARAQGKVHQPLRWMIRAPGAQGMMVLMPSVMTGAPAPPAAPRTLTAPAPPAAPTAPLASAAPAEPAEPARPAGRPTGEPGYGLKAICVSPGNPALGLDSHQGAVLVSDTRTGRPLALLNASAVTEIRTAAVSAAATALLARPDAATFAIVGTGVQARAHARAIAATRPLTQIRVAGRDAERAGAFAAKIGDLAGVAAVGCGSVAEALAGADIVVTATTSAAPVVRLGWLTPGAHINAVGACVPEAREIDAETMAAAALFVDSRESAAHEAGDFVIAVAEGAIGPGHILAELGDVLTGAAPGRRNDNEITVFESLGLAVEDLAAAAHAYRRAGELGIGTWVDF